jgi:hypothetical protein
LTVLPPAPNSGVLVFAKINPPALRTLATLDSSRSGTWSLNSSDPLVVLSLAVACRSFTPIGKPGQNPDLLSPHESLLDRRRALTRCIQIDSDDRVHESVGCFDPTGAALQQRRRRKRAPADEPPRLDSGKVARLGHGALFHRSGRMTLRLRRRALSTTTEDASAAGRHDRWI